MVARGLHGVVASLIPRGKGKLLNLGCENWMPAEGHEDMTPELLEGKEYEIYNVDAQDRPLPNLHVFDLDQPWHLPDNEFDVVLSVELIEHLENPWHHAREIARVMKPDGVCILTTPNILAPFKRELWDEGYFNWFGPGEWAVPLHERGHINPMPIHELRKIFNDGDFRGVHTRIEKELYHPPEVKECVVLVIRRR